MPPRSVWLIVVPTALLTALLLATPGQAQGPTRAQLSGRVTEARVNTPVVGATVTLEGARVSTLTDADGRYRLLDVPSGPQTLVVRRLGFAPVRQAVTVPLQGVRTVDIVLATSSLQLDQVTVTADVSGRARGELGTASVIDRDAIANQAAPSLQGVLELVPGVVVQPPGLDGTQQFSLRSLGTQSSIGTTAGGPSAADLASFGTLIILDGVPLSNNANLQTVGPRGEVASPGSTAGGGIDLRRIPASTLERVEVIRGVPSARYGDLTQGAIVIDTRAATSAPEGTLRLDARTLRLDARTNELSGVGGHTVGGARNAVTIAANRAATSAVPTLSNDLTTRSALQLAHRSLVGGTDATPAVVFDTRLDAFSLRFNRPERAEIEEGRSSFTEDVGFRFNERARWQRGPASLVEWTLAYDHQRQRTSETAFRSRSASPFTPALSEGRNIGSFTDGAYLAAYDIEGDPRLLYTRLEWDRDSRVAGMEWRTRVGGEARREWNEGRGYLFDIERPPQVTFNGVNGYDRPRRVDSLPAVATTAGYVDARVRARPLGVATEVQAGWRVDALHNDGWTGGVRSAIGQPRLNVQIAPIPWFRLRGGAGRTTKVPTNGQLFPALQWYDLVNVNRYTPDPAERLAVLTTFVRNPTNDNLGLQRSDKREVGFELDGGRKFGAVSMTWFDDRITGGVSTRNTPFSLFRDNYTLADTGRGTGQPGRIVDPPISRDTMPVFLTQFVNGAALGTSGVEYTFAFPDIPQLRTRLEVTGARFTTQFSTEDREYGIFTALNAFQTDTSIRRLAYFAPLRRRSEQHVTTYRIVHHQPDLGLVITTLVQRITDQMQETRTGTTDSIPFQGFLSRNGTLTDVPLADRNDPQYNDLRSNALNQLIRRQSLPDDWVLTLQVAKSIAGDGRLLVYAFNAVDRLSRFGTPRFGVEVVIPTARYFGDRW